ncbi:MAG: hypothetical protein SNJ83_04695 [Aggregatilineales bacterium]
MVATFSGRLIADAYATFFKRSNQIISELEHRVDMIIDLSGVTSYDVPGLLRIAPQMNAFTARNYGLSVVIGMSPAARVVADAASHLAPRLVNTIRRANTLNDAYRIITEERASAAQPTGSSSVQSHRL